MTQRRNVTLLNKRVRLVECHNSRAGAYIVSISLGNFFPQPAMAEESLATGRNARPRASLHGSGQISRILRAWEKGNIRSAPERRQLRCRLWAVPRHSRFESS